MEGLADAVSDANFELENAVPRLWMYIYHGAGNGLQLPAFTSGVKGFGENREPLSELYHTNAPLLFELEGADFVPLNFDFLFGCDRDFRTASAADVQRGGSDISACDEFRDAVH